MVSTELPWEKFAHVKFLRGKFTLFKSPRGEFPWGKFHPRKIPAWKTPPYPFLKLFLLKRCFFSEKSDFLFTREININIYNRLYLFINKTDYLSDSFNINKMHSNKDLDLI